MKAIYDIQTEECKGFAEGVDRVFRKLPTMSSEEVLSQMEATMNHIRVCQNLGFTDSTLVGYLNKMGALIAKQLQNMEMV